MPLLELFKSKLYLSVFATDAFPKEWNGIIPISDVSKSTIFEFKGFLKSLRSKTH